MKYELILGNPCYMYINYVIINYVHMYMSRK